MRRLSRAARQRSLRRFCIRAETEVTAVEAAAVAVAAVAVAAGWAATRGSTVWRG